MRLLLLVWLLSIITVSGLRADIMFREPLMLIDGDYVVNGESFPGYTIVNGSSTLTINGGEFGKNTTVNFGLVTQEDSTLILRDGFVYGGDLGLSIAGNSEAHIHGGAVISYVNLWMVENSDTYIYGTDFMEVTHPFLPFPTVTGRFANGDSFGFTYNIRGNAEMHLVVIPEPGTSILLVLAGIGGIAVNRFRKRHGKIV